MCASLAELVTTSSRPEPAAWTLAPSSLLPPPRTHPHLAPLSLQQHLPQPTIHLHPSRLPLSLPLTVRTFQTNRQTRHNKYVTKTVLVAMATTLSHASQTLSPYPAFLLALLL